MCIMHPRKLTLKYITIKLKADYKNNDKIPSTNADLFYISNIVF